MKADYHIHPLGHKYRGQDYSPAKLKNITLDEQDKKAIRAVVDWCVNERRLECISLTDHDMLASSIYAQEYVKEARLPLMIIPGAECKVSVPGFPAWNNCVHVLCYGISELPDYSHNTPLPEFAKKARSKGAMLVLAHPVMYMEIFEKYYPLFDGYEEQSGTTPYLDLTGIIDLVPYQNSNFHYNGELPTASHPNLWFNHRDPAPGCYKDEYRRFHMEDLLYRQLVDCDDLTLEHAYYTLTKNEWPFSQQQTSKIVMNKQVGEPLRIKASKMLSDQWLISEAVLHAGYWIGGGSIDKITDVRLCLKLLERTSDDNVFSFAATRLTILRDISYAADQEIYAYIAAGCRDEKNAEYAVSRINDSRYLIRILTERGGLIKAKTRILKLLTSKDIRENWDTLCSLLDNIYLKESIQDCLQKANADRWKSYLKNL